jgi:transcriptional regulator GlxA family with amidase domain
LKPTLQMRKSRFVFLTLPQYSQIALANAVEPLRMANSISGQAAYEWQIASLDGQPVAASNGLSISPTMALEQAGRPEIVFICGGRNVRDAVTPTLLAALRRLSEQGTGLGALCTGGYALARAGLLDRCRATIHWENVSALREEFPRIIISDQVFTIDRNRYTASGGVAPLDLMLNLIETKLGSKVAQLVSEQFIVDRIRSDKDRQYVPLRAQVGVSHQRIAQETGLSRRQIERLFKRHLNCVPKRYYLELRLKRARELLLQTAMPIMDITTACGFQSPPHFSKCYRKQFGYPPSVERQSPRRVTPTSDAPI